MIFDLFDSPELLEVQRAGFYSFLKEGVSHLLAKEFPIEVKNGRYSIELSLNEKGIKLIAPEDNPRDCILKMKTYNCKLYAQVKVTFKKPSGRIVYQSLPEWVLLGQLPMMTKRGHFIINGSPRVIVHQIVRAPGIYFQKAIKKDDQNRSRFYGDIIPLKGAWVRLQMTKKGRVEAKFKKGKKVEVEFLQKCLQVIENQTLSFTKDENNARQLLPFKTFSSDIASRDTTFSTYKASLCNPSHFYEQAAKAFSKKRSRVESRAEDEAFVHTYDKLYRTTQDKELEEWQKKKKNRIFFKRPSLSFAKQNQKFCEAKPKELLKDKFYPSCTSLFGKKVTEIPYSKRRSFEVLQISRSSSQSVSKPLKIKDKAFVSERKEDTQLQINGFDSRLDSKRAEEKKNFYKNSGYESTYNEENKSPIFNCKSFASQNSQYLARVRSEALARFCRAKPTSTCLSSNLRFVNAKLMSCFACTYVQPLYKSKICTGTAKRMKGHYVQYVRVTNRRFVQHKKICTGFRVAKAQSFASSKESRKRSFFNKPFEGSDNLSQTLLCRTGIKSSICKPRASYKSPICQSWADVNRSGRVIEKKDELTSFVLSSLAENTFKRKKCSENLFSTFKIESRYDLGRLGREKINKKFAVFIKSSQLQKRANEISFTESTSIRRDPFKKQSFSPRASFLRDFIPIYPTSTSRAFAPLSDVHYAKKKVNAEFVKKDGSDTTFKEPNTHQLTALDLCYATLWLYRLRKGEESTDDIDHSQNRRVRTSGELFQSQFENGVYRLKNLLLTKLQEWRGDLSISLLSSIFKESYSLRYNSCSLSKQSSLLKLANKLNFKNYQIPLPGITSKGIKSKICTGFCYAKGQSFASSISESRQVVAQRVLRKQSNLSLLSFRLFRQKRGSIKTPFLSFTTSTDQRFVRLFSRQDYNENKENKKRGKAAGLFLPFSKSRKVNRGYKSSFFLPKIFFTGFSYAEVKKKKVFPNSIGRRVIKPSFNNKLEKERLNKRLDKDFFNKQNSFSPKKVCTCDVLPLHLPYFARTNLLMLHVLYKSSYAHYKSTICTARKDHEGKCLTCCALPVSTGIKRKNRFAQHVYSAHESCKAEVREIKREKKGLHVLYKSNYTHYFALPRALPLRGISCFRYAKGQSFASCKGIAKRMKGLHLLSRSENEKRSFFMPLYKSTICTDKVREAHKKICTGRTAHIARTVQNKYKSYTVKDLFSTKPITGALREFFGSNPLSQYMDQTNPLAEITHKRRISSLGIGGVSRESAGMAIRGIHPTHYGRICPIETPEGKNAGLVNSLAFYTKVDKDGFLKTPYYRVFKGQVQPALGFSFCSAKNESLTGLQIAPSDLQRSQNNILRTRLSLPESVPVRVTESFLDIFKKENPYKVEAIAISPIQMISVATSLIPFLEHNDANRALMGSNMQRQAVPLMISERPVVGTGLECRVIVESGQITESCTSGFVSHVTASEIVVDRLFSKTRQSIDLSKKQVTSSFITSSSLKSCSLSFPLPFLRSNYLSTNALYHARNARLQHRKTCVAGTAKQKKQKNLSLFFRRTEDKALTSKSSRLISTFSFLTTFSRSNQNTCITERPLVKEFDWVQKGDILTDCSASKNGCLAVGKNVLLAYIPWEGYNFEDAIVISDRLVREHVYTSLHIERYVFQAQDLKEGSEWFTKHLPGVEPSFIEHLEESGLPKSGSFLKEGDIIVGKIRYLNKKPSSPYERLLCDILGEKNFSARNKSLYVPKGVEARVIYHKVISFFENDSENKVRPLNAAKTIHIFLGEKRVIQVGDKISGRHGNKGVISTILPRQDMPYLPDGTPIDVVLNPLGVPSRMNVGQVLESLLGLAATYLNQHFKTSAFDERYGVEASKSIVFLKLYQARLMSGQNWLFQVSFPGKTRLIDGRSGECFDQWITVGRAYILKLIHMVSEKIHARSTGPYALITQQPLRGRSNKGGQRLGEMEVWALEGFGAAYTLQELLTKKSDDFFGRKQIVDSILPLPNRLVDALEPSSRVDKNRSVLGHPEIFKVLLCELQALCLDLGVYVVTPESFQRTFLGVVD